MVAGQYKPDLIPKVDPVSTPILIEGKSRKRGGGRRKLYDDLGNEINQQDADIMNDIE